MPGSLLHGRTEVAKVPGTGIDVIQKSQESRVRVLMSHRTHKSSRYYCLTGVYYSKQFRACTHMYMLYRYPGILVRGYRRCRDFGYSSEHALLYTCCTGTRVFRYGRTEVVEISGTDMSDVQNPQKFRVYMSQNVQNSEDYWRSGVHNSQKSRVRAIPS